MSNEDQIREQIQELENRCAYQRLLHFEQAKGLSRINKFFTVFAALLAATSVGSLAALLAKIINDPTTMTTVAMVASAISGIVSILVVNYADTRTITHHFEAASAYLELREMAKSARVFPAPSEDSLHASLRNIQDQYVSASKFYDKLGLNSRSRIARLVASVKHEFEFKVRREP